MNAPVVRKPGLPATTLSTDRLLMRASTSALAAAVSDYQARNAEHFNRWDPIRPPDYWDVAPTRERLAQYEEAFQAGTLWRYWFVRPEAPDRVIGQCALSQVARGVFQSAMLGYSLDAAEVGHGLMHEALSRLRDEVFSERVWLHRLQASVRPENGRSRHVLERLGFAREGFSPRYLYIHGAWRDHETFALINPDWGDQPPPEE
ncbi:GNAT family N-acetyltransferase [Roseateles sp.]|uniref:GNAT family N-acetyltransferase n=1 Tax=Roseateles sp. TaxID=1971397 RepID=UPI0031DD56CF